MALRQELATGILLHGRAEGSSAIGDGGQAAMSLMPDVYGTHVCIFERLKLEVS